MTIKTMTAPLYNSPEENATMVDEALHGMVVSIEYTKGDWFYVQTAYRYKGWVHRSHLTDYRDLNDNPNNNPNNNSNDNPNDNPNNNPNITQKTKYINTASADVLTAPKVQAPLLICLTLGCTVHVSEQANDNTTIANDNTTKTNDHTNGYTKIHLADNRTGYIRTDFLSSFPDKITRRAVCDTALLYLNTQYRWGGKTPYGIDCSGLCFMAYWLNGVAIYRDAKIQPGFPIKEIQPKETQSKKTQSKKNQSKEIQLKQAQEGDLIYFPGHVGILLDENTMIHSSEKRNGVKIEPLTPEWKNSITALGRLISAF